MAILGHRSGGGGGIRPFLLIVVSTSSCNRCRSVAPAFDGLAEGAALVELVEDAVHVCVFWIDQQFVLEKG